MEKYNGYEQNDPKNNKEKKEQKENASTMNNADEYCEAVDGLVDGLDEMGMSENSKRKIGNTLKVIGGIAERTDLVVGAYEDVKNTFTTKKGFTKFMLRYAVAPTIIQVNQEKTRIQKKADEISKSIHFLGLEKDTTNIENVIDECTDEEIDGCIE